MGYKITHLVKKLILQYQRRIDGVKWVQLVTYPRNMKHRTWKHPRYLTVVKKASLVNWTFMHQKAKQLNQSQNR